MTEFVIKKLNNVNSHSCNRCSNSSYVGYFNNKVYKGNFYEIGISSLLILCDDCAKELAKQIRMEVK